MCPSAGKETPHDRATRAEGAQREGDVRLEDALHHRMLSDMRSRRYRPLPPAEPGMLGAIDKPSPLITKPLIARRAKPVARDPVPPYRPPHPYFPRQMSEDACRSVTRRLIGALSMFTGEPVGIVLGPTRAHRISRPRQTAMYLCRWYTGMSLPEVAVAFGMADHTTCVHALRAVGERLRGSSKATERKALFQLAALASLDQTPSSPETY